MKLENNKKIQAEFITASILRQHSCQSGVIIKCYLHEL